MLKAAALRNALIDWQSLAAILIEFCRLYLYSPTASTAKILADTLCSDR